MKIILLLCAAFALSIATEPVEEVAAAQEVHLDEAMPPQMSDGELPPVEAGQMLADARQSSCPSGWSKYGSRCFIYMQRELAWVDAEKYCIRYGANLASVHNTGEYQFIQEVIRGSTGRFPRAWIGGNAAVKDFAWLWSDGTGFHFQDWTIGEPDNNGGTEKCVVMNQPDDHLWGDWSCSEKLPFICGTRPV